MTGGAGGGRSGDDVALRSVAAHLAGILEDGSLLAAKARTHQDAQALKRLGQDVVDLAAAMEVLSRPG